MAKMTIKAGDEYMTKLSYAGTGVSAMSKKAIFEGAKIITDAIRAKIQNLPEEKFRFLKTGEKFSGVPKEHKQALLDGLGIMRISEDKNGDYMTRIGWEGYAGPTTASTKYPRGLPAALIARSINKGTIVRRKIPFVRQAINEEKGRATAAMDEVINRELEKLMKR